jgi:hypothetical protein
MSMGEQLSGFVEGTTDPTTGQTTGAGWEWPRYHSVPFGMFDSVEKPSHYASGDIECIDAMRAQMSKEEFEGHMKGNVIKYMWRWRDKGGVESLKKARWYLNKLIESAE